MICNAILDPHSVKIGMFWMKFLLFQLRTTKSNKQYNQVYRTPNMNIVYSITQFTGSKCYLILVYFLQNM